MINTLKSKGGKLPKNINSVLIRNLIKVWRIVTGHADGREWSKGPKSALFEILQNREHLYYSYLVVRLWFS